MKAINKYIGAIALGSAILAAPSCSDTWDDHYSGGEGTSATESLWEIISSNPNLSKFAAIAEKSHYYKDEEHPQANYTFKDMLNGSQILTAWVPDNNAISDEEFEKWMELAETSGYSVQQQLLANNIALWRNIYSGGGEDTLRMLNGKKIVFNKDQFTMAGLPVEERNIAATNGTLHVMSDIIPFNYNLYEYLKDGANASANEMQEFHNFVIDADTTYFSENNSIEGNPDANGNPTYVDSVYLTSNTLFMGTKRFPTNNNTDTYLTYDESFGANIECEDSAFVMIYPTNTAWNNAREMLSSLYNYAPIYVDNQKANDGTTGIFREITNTDSLKQKCIDMDIASPLCYNLHLQPNAAGQKNRWQMKDFIDERGASAEYLLNTYGDTLRSDENWDKSTIFQGTPIEMSNGYAFIADEWAFPRKLYQPNLEIEVGYRSLYNTSKATGSATSFSFSNTAAASWIDEKGRVSHDNFYYISSNSANAKPKFEFKLVGTDGENQESEVMSGTYEMYLVLVPNYYMISSDSIIINSNVAMINDNDTIPFKHKIRVELSYNNGDPKGKETVTKSDFIIYEGTKVDTLLVRFPEDMKNGSTYSDQITFPYSYKNLRQCYPTVSISAESTNNERKEGYTNNFCIDRILLISKEN